MTNLKPTRMILIVGASGEIGGCICEAFHSIGEEVVATYSNPVSLSRESDQSLHLDLADALSIDHFIQMAKDRAYVFDIIIFVSGFLPGMSPEEYDFPSVDKVMAINLSGPCKLLFGLLQNLKQDAKILFFSSISAQRGSYDPIYAAAKGGLLSFVKSMVKHLPKQTTINAIAPGLIEGGGMFSAMESERADFHRQQIHSGSLLDMTDLAKLVVDLTAPHWSHLNGACIDLNGGQYLR